MFFVSLLTMAVFSGPVDASEFIADVVIKGGMMSGHGKIWVKGHKMRQEFGARAENMIMIMDLDQGYQWMLMPENKMCIKTKIQSKGKGFRPENFIGMQEGPMEAQIERVGTETVNGYKCDKYLFKFEYKEMGTMTQWFAEELGYPIKTVNKTDMMGEVTTELRDISLESVQDDLFIVPSDYKEIKQPVMPPISSGE
jgi:hypothetical protein